MLVAQVGGSRGAPRLGLEGADDARAAAQARRRPPLRDALLGGGPLRDGVLHGDLVVEGSGDPFFVDENALLVLLALRELGVRRVAGDVAVRGPFLFDWETRGRRGAARAGARRSRPAGGLVGRARRASARARRAGEAPALAFGNARRAGASAPDAARRRIARSRWCRS